MAGGQRGLRRLRDAWAPRLAAIRGDAVRAAPNGSGAQYGVTWLGHNLPDGWQEGEPFYAHVSVRNAGTRTWSAQGHRRVDLALRVNRQVHSFAPCHTTPHPGPRSLSAFRSRFPLGSGTGS